MTTLEGTWLTEGGLETGLIFNHGVDLPEFAVFPLLDTPERLALLTEYCSQVAELASAEGPGLQIETPPWRASANWGRCSGTTPRRSIAPTTPQ